MRKLVSVIVGAGLLVSLSACSSTPAGFAGCVTPAGNSALVTANGSFGADPKADFPTPIISTSSDLHVLEAGDGEAVNSHDGADITVSFYDGESGEPVTNDSTGPLTALKLRVFVDGSLPFATALECAPVGSRVVTTGTAADLLGAVAANIGVADDKTIVIVSDVDRSFLGRANGVDQLAQAGFPSIVLAPNGQPGFTIPDGSAPTELKIAALKQGNGDTVAAGDNVIVNLSGLVWGASETFSSSWDNAAPATIPATSIVDDPNGIVPGLLKAIVGQQVGSQVIAIVPPADGYPEGSAPANVPAGSTLVFVVDILGIN